MSVPPELKNKADVPMLDILEKSRSTSGTPSSSTTGTTAEATSIIEPADTIFSKTADDNSNLFGSMGHHSSSAVSPTLLGSTNGHHQPIVISMSLTTLDECYTTARPSRESVLQRLSEALLRRSLTKVCWVLFCYVVNCHRLCIGCCA